MNMLSTSELRMLTNIGCSALSGKNMKGAERIFKSIIPYCSATTTGPQIGLALAMFGQGQVAQAIAILKEDALIRNPDCVGATLNLALVLRFDGLVDESNSYISSARKLVLDEVTEQFARNIESGVLDAI